MTTISTEPAPASAPRIFDSPQKLIEARNRLVAVINELNSNYVGYSVDDPASLPQMDEFWRGPSGISRVCYREDDVKSRTWLQEKFREAGCERVWMDTWGNVFAEMGRADATPIFIRSHTDSVDQGGPLDGILGVMIGVVLAEYLTPEKIPSGFKLVFGSNAAEELLYGGHYIGSEALSGHLPKDWFDTAKSPENTTLAADMEKMGLTHDFSDVYADLDQVALSLEVHIEQDDQLEKVGLPLGLPEAISGVRYFHMYVTANDEIAGNQYHLLRPLMEMGNLYEKITPPDTPMPEPSATAAGVAIQDLDVHPNNAFQVPGRFSFVLSVSGAASNDSLEGELRALCDWIMATERTKIKISGVGVTEEHFSCHIDIEGYAEHEGAPPMNERRDAFRSFCKFRKFFDKLTGEAETSPAEVSVAPTKDTRMTIGLMEITGNKLYYTVVAKETEDSVLNDLQASVENIHNSLPKQFPVTTESEFGGYANPVKCDQTAIALAEKIASQEGFGIQRMVSMPSHDVTQFPVPLLIFVRNQNGSHNPKETMRAEDLDPLLTLVDELLASLHS